MFLTENYIKRLQELAGVKSINLLEESFSLDYVVANYLNNGKVSKELYDDIVSWDKSQGHADLPTIFKFIIGQ